MKRLQLLLRDRRRRQRGSILGGLLIIVAFLTILIGALLTELTDSFVVSQDLVAKAKTEATVTSAAELAINGLQNGPVPPVCAQDTSANPAPPRPATWTLPSALNGYTAAVSQTCNAIVPEVVTSLAAGSANTEGIHDTLAGANRYLVSVGGYLWAYPFGSTGFSWAVPEGGTATAPPQTARDPNGSVDILVPVANKVDVFNDRGGVPVLTCPLAATGAVTSSPAAGANFSGYAFFADSGQLYVYDVHAGGGCPIRRSAGVAGVAAPPLVFPGQLTINGNTSTVSDEIFVLVTSGSSTSLQHWRYTESTEDCSDDPDCNGGQGGSATTYTLNRIASLFLNGANAVGYGLSAAAPAPGIPLNVVVATASGRLDLAQITVRSGPSYNTAPGASVVLPNGSSAGSAPYWCHCPGQDLIGVGSTNGFLYLFNGGLSLAYSYDGQPDNWPAIDTTPMADVNGEWYFGANDGSIYDVEIPMSGTQMFKAAKFGPGGAITSSPIVGTCLAGQVGPCLYFASSSGGSYFARIGTTRISELRACVSSALGSTTCAGNPRLWARVQVGPAGVWGGSGVFVQGWSFYSP